MQVLNKTWESKHKIRFTDCDPFNHLNNSRYLDYLINAREDHLLQFHQFDLVDLARVKGLSWVVKNHQIVYQKPAFLMETVVICSALLQMNEKETVVEMSMWNEGRTILKALLWTTFVHFNLHTKKTELHSASLTEMFAPYKNLEIWEKGFAPRLEQLKMVAGIELP